MDSGYLYVANKEKFIKEATISAKSLRMNSFLPIALITTEKLVDEQVKSIFDLIIIVDELESYTYLSKIIGLQHSPFQKTIFLDSDTFVCSSIDDLFTLLDFVDIATTQEVKQHTHKFQGMKYQNVFPEFNSGVIVIRKNETTSKLLHDWLKICEDLKIQIDMPGLREAILKNFDAVKYSILSEEYNSHGYKSMLLLNGEVKVIHERISCRWNTITPHFSSFEEMKRFAAKLNKKHYKRIFVPYFGIIPYNYSPYIILQKIKRMIGIKRVSKTKHF